MCRLYKILKLYFFKLRNSTGNVFILVFPPSLFRYDREDMLLVFLFHLTVAVYPIMLQFAFMYLKNALQHCLIQSLPRSVGYSPNIGKMTRHQHILNAATMEFDTKNVLVLFSVSPSELNLQSQNLPVFLCYAYHSAKPHPPNLQERAGCSAKPHRKACFTQQQSHQEPRPSCFITPSQR